MKTKHISGLFGASLLCFLAVVFFASKVDAGSMKGKLERCRKSIKTNSTKAMDCFTEVMLEGNAEEKHLASYFLGVLVEGGDNVPTLAEAAENIRNQAKPSGEARNGSVATAVIYHGKKTAPKKNIAPAQRGSSRAKPSRAQASMPARKKAPARAYAQAQRKPGAGAQVGGSFEVDEAPETFEKEAAQTKPYTTVDVSSITLQEIDQTPEMTVEESVKHEAPVRPVASDTIGEEDDSKVALARLNTNTAAFTVEDDLAPELETSNEQVLDVLFETNGLEIGDAQMGVMAQAAKLMENSSAKMTVRGLAAPGENNPDKLSKMRAKIVELALKQKFLVPSGKIKVEWGVGINKDDQRVILAVKTQ